MVAGVAAGSCVSGRMALAQACAGVQRAGKPGAHGDGLLSEHDLRRMALAVARACWAGSPWVALGASMHARRHHLRRMALARAGTPGEWRWRVRQRMACWLIMLVAHCACPHVR